MADESTLYGRGCRSLPRRQRNPPRYLCDYELEEKAEEDEIEISKVEEEVMYEVEDVMERRDNEVLVKWRGYGPEHNSWVNLANNRELSGWLQKHASHPQSSTLAKESISSLDSLERELWFVKNLVFDELNLRHTSEGDEGVLGRMQVKAPFSNEAFVHYFGKGTFPLAKERGLDFSGTENVKFTATVAEVGSVLGADWKARCFSNSSTVCEVDPVLCGVCSMGVRAQTKLRSFSLPSLFIHRRGTGSTRHLPAAGNCCSIRLHPQAFFRETKKKFASRCTVSPNILFYKLKKIHVVLITFLVLLRSSHYLCLVGRELAKN